MKNILILFVVLFPLPLTVVPVSASDLVICKNSTGKIFMSNSGGCPAGYLTTSKSSSAAYARDPASSFEYETQIPPERQAVLNWEAREEFKQSVYDQIGGNPNAISEEGVLRDFEQSGGYKRLFSHVFKFQRNLFWNDMERMTPEQKQYWNEAVATQKAGLTEQARAKKQRLTEQYNELMNEYDKQVTEDNFIREEERAAKIQASERANLLAEQEEAEQERSRATQKPAKLGSTTGTGFIISRDGHIITCNHVIADSLDIEILIGNNHYRADVIDSDEYNDLALLKITNTDSPMSPLPLSTGNSAQMGESVFTIGFPNPSIQGRNAKMTRGEINSLSGLQDDSRLYQISVPVQPGNSGGPLIDSYGNVTGVIVSVLNAQKVFKYTGAIPQNVNYAIKGNIIKSFLDNLLVKITAMPRTNNKQQSLSDVADKILDSIVMIIAKR